MPPRNRRWGESGMIGCNYQKVIDIVHETKSIVLNKNLRAKIKEKGPADFVTAVDTEVCNFIGAELKKLYPDIGFTSEEKRDSETRRNNRWILDPIDGTTNLVFKYPLSSVSLALLQNGEIIFGVVYNPFSDETFYAEKGKGAFLNGKELAVSTRNIGESLVEFGAGVTQKQDANQMFKIAQSVFMDCVDIRRICSSALAICYIACKRIDGYFEKVLKPWDHAAAGLILQEAGGKVTDWFGKPLQYEKSTTIVASNGRIQDYLLSKVK